MCSRFSPYQEDVALYEFKLSRLSPPGPKYLTTPKIGKNPQRRITWKCLSSQALKKANFDAAEKSVEILSFISLQDNCHMRKISPTKMKERISMDLSAALKFALSSDLQWLLKDEIQHSFQNSLK
jgi:hypothetical protein